MIHTNRDCLSASQSKLVMGNILLPVRTTELETIAGRNATAGVAPDRHHKGLKHNATSVSQTTSLKLVAVCLAGAARTIVHPVVLHTHRHHLLRAMDADLYAVVNLQKSTTHSGLTRLPESELTRRGTERWRVSQALNLLGALEIVFQEDEAMPPHGTCIGSHGGFTWVSMMWNVQRCGELVRQHEETRRLPYAWVVRARPDTFFRRPVSPPPATALAAYYCTNNDAFFVASRAAAPGLFSVWSLAFELGCAWVGNTSLSRSLPRNFQCGLEGAKRTEGFIYPDCIFRLAAYRHRLVHLGCQDVLATFGRDFFRAHNCNASEPCITKGWASRAPSVYFPMSIRERPSDHGNLSIDRDIHDWGVATGAILEADSVRRIR